MKCVTTVFTHLSKFLGDADVACRSSPVCTTTTVTTVTTTTTTTLTTVTTTATTVTPCTYKHYTGSIIYICFTYFVLADIKND